MVFKMILIFLLDNESGSVLSMGDLMKNLRREPHLKLPSMTALRRARRFSSSERWMEERGV